MGVKAFIESVMSKPWVQHIVAAVNRYLARLGPQFAAAVTYFSILSMVPVLMFGISALGYTLTVLRPDLLEPVMQSIRDLVGSTEADDTVGQAVDNVLGEWRSFSVFAILIAAYTGSKWVGNLKRAFRVMWRDKFSQASERRNFFLEQLENLVIFIGLLLCVVVAIGMTVAGTQLSEQIIGWLGLEHVPGISWMLRGVTIVLTFVAGWLLFAFVFFTLPGETTSVRSFLIGTTVGGLIVMVIQQLAGLLFSAFSGNAAASIFGPIIVLMLVFNTLATLILLIAAWVGTSHIYVAELERGERNKARGVTMDIEDEEPQPVALAATRERVEVDKQRQKARIARLAATRRYDSLRTAHFDPTTIAEPDENVMVNQKVAATGMKVASRLGYGLGAATGVGLGALVAGLFRRR